MPLALNSLANRLSAFDRNRLGVAIVLLVSAGSAALIVHQGLLDAEPAQPRWVAKAPIAASTPAALPRIERPVPEPVPTGNIALVGDRIEIDIRAMPLGEAARQLAVATRTPLDSIAALRDATGQVTLKWRGADAGVAWQLLLANGVNYVARCIEGTCLVSVLGLIAPSPVERLALAGGVAAARSALPAVTALPGITAFAAANAGKTSAAGKPAPLPLPDPPGLFPADG